MAFTISFLKRKNYTLKEFNSDNSESILLNGSLYDIYETFKDSKRKDLIKEYGDLTCRLLNLTGIISFRNGLVSLPTFSLEVFQQLFEKVDIKLVEDDNYALYEEDIESDFFQNITFMNFVKI